MEPEKIYLDPRTNKSRITKSHKQRRYKCPLCPKNWANRHQAVHHIKTCIQINKQSILQNKLGFRIQKDLLEEQNRQEIRENLQQQPQIDYQVKLMKNQEYLQIAKNNQESNKKITALQKQLKVMQSQMIKIKAKIPSLGQIVQFEQLQYITNQIVQNQLVTNLLKSTIQPQVYQLLQTGFSVSQIIGKGKNIISEKISQVRIVQSFSKHSNNMLKIEKQLQQQYKKKDKAYRSQIMSAFNFLKKFSESQLKFQSKLIEQLSQMSFYKRKMVFTLYQRLRTVFSDLFRYDMLPQRLVKIQGGNKLKRRKINIKILFSEIKRLLNSHFYALACDIWMGLCLGLRSSQYKIINIQRGTGEIAKRIRLTENKNNNMIMRIIPRSLANIVKKHDINYPITEERFTQARQFCLQTFGTFYGLRSLTISLILSKLAYESQVGRFHGSVSTTQKFYLNTDIQQVVHGIFALQGYDEDIQSNIQVFLQYETAEFHEIIQTSYVMNLQQNANQYLQNTEKDSIILAEIQEKQLTLVNKVRKIQLQNNIQAGKEQYSSLNQALNLSDHDNISELCNSQNLYVSVVQFNSEIMKIQAIQEIGQKGGSEAQLIKTISSQSLENQLAMVFKFDQAKMLRQQLIDKVKSFKKSKLPLLRKFVKCCSCSKRFMINQCGNHFKLSCEMHGDYHMCQEAVVGKIIKQRKLINSSTIHHDLKLKKIELVEKNNIKRIIELTHKKYAQRIIYSENVPQFKISMPIGNQQLFEAIKQVQQNQQFLPLQIKQTKLGYGVFAKVDIPKNTLVCTYSGVIQIGEFVNNSDDCLVDFGMLKVQDQVFNLLLTCSQYCNVGKFFNSSKTFNSKSRNLTLEKTVDEHNRVTNIMFTTKQILKGQQMKWYYGQQYWASSKIQPLSDQEDNNQNNQYNTKKIICQNKQIQQFQQSLQDGIFEDDHQNLFQQQMINEINKIVKPQTYFQQTKQVHEKILKALIIHCQNRTICCNPDLLVEIASIVKILNAKVCLKQIDHKKITWQTQFQMPNYFADQSTRAYLKTHKRYTVKDLMRALLIPSGCDAAYCLAYNLGKLYNQTNPIQEFVKNMNKQALELEMFKTKILEPTGYGNSVSCAKDLIKLLKWMRGQERLCKFLKQKSLNLERNQLNSNQLLSMDILGKTGNSRADGHSFIGFHEQQNILIVALGAHQSFITYSKIREYLKKIKAGNFK